MIGSATQMLGFMEGADKRYVIPVYQRKYSWKLDNCRQLFRDLKKVVQDKRESHFFGSMVSSVEGKGGKTEYHIIDGQQRLTTVSLLLLAISNLVANGEVKSSEEKLCEQINQRFLISPWAKDDDKIKLRLVKGDRDAYAKLFEDEKDFDRSSNLTLNYLFFREMVLKQEVSVDDLYSAIGKLEIISITLESYDNAQLIFESLNSTGLALSEGDKIRNYILMGLKPKDQTQFYDKYWAKIEKCTADNVSDFVRDYLSIKQQKTPTISAVYPAFKLYAEDAGMSVEILLEDMLRYARFYWKLQNHVSETGEKKLDDCMYRMTRLEIVVTRPFLMEVLRLHQDGKLSVQDVLQVFQITENYLFRRNICEVPTNALNKIFLLLNKEILRYDNTAGNYVEKLIYALRSKKESGRFPDDIEFAAALSAKQVYLMRGKYKAYLFERFENYGTIETKDVYTHLDNNDYTIEHIMPQHLSLAWTEALGADAMNIHSTWLHRLANLTLTGYNPSLSNKGFIEKRDAENGGYKVSGLKMNQKIAQKDQWGLSELEERDKDMVTLALKIWSCPETDFEPAEKTLDSCMLDDDVVLTGRDIVRYSFMGVEQPVSSWADMFERVVNYLHQKDKSVLSSLAYGFSDSVDIAKYVSNKEDGVRFPLKIEDGIYIEKNTTTENKITILKRLFNLYDVDPIELVFYLKNEESGKEKEEERHKLRKRYWAYALPIIRERNKERGVFSKVIRATYSNTVSGFFGIGGFYVNCVANYDSARVEFYLGKGDGEENKKVFDLLFSHKDEIENELGVQLTWDRADQYKASWMSYSLNNVGITNESDWSRMAEFHAEWSKKLCDTILPYLKDMATDNDRLDKIADALRQWAISKNEIHLDLAKSNRTNTRFTTDAMSEILPNIPGVLSGWNTENRYYYEIVNRTGNGVYISFAISSRNATPEFLSICDRINEYYPAKFGKKDWQWRNPFKSKTVEIDKDITLGKLFADLDSCLEEIKAFEKDLKAKLAK